MLNILHFSGSTLSRGSQHEAIRTLPIKPLPVSSVSSHSDTKGPVGSVLSPYMRASSNLCFCSEGSYPPCLPIPAQVTPIPTFLPSPTLGSLLCCLWLGKVPLPSYPALTNHTLGSSCRLWALGSNCIQCLAYRSLCYNECALCSMPNGLLSVPGLIPLVGVNFIFRITETLALYILRLFVLLFISLSVN